MFRPLEPGDPNETCWAYARGPAWFRLFRLFQRVGCVFMQFHCQRHFGRHRWTDRTINAARAFCRRQRLVQRGFEGILCCGRTEIVSPKSSITLKNVRVDLLVRVGLRENRFLSGSWARRNSWMFRFWSKSGQTDYSALIERLSFPFDSAVPVRIVAYVAWSGMSRRRCAKSRSRSTGIVGCQIHRARCLRIGSIPNRSPSMPLCETFTLAGGFVRPKRSTIYSERSRPGDRRSQGKPA